jgi:hypothetical protein
MIKWPVAWQWILKVICQRNDGNVFPCRILRTYYNTFVTFTFIKMHFELHFLSISITFCSVAPLLYLVTDLLQCSSFLLNVQFQTFSKPIHFKVINPMLGKILLLAFHLFQIWPFIALHCSILYCMSISYEQNVLNKN